MDINKNYYSILGVTHNSTNTEIKKKYYKLSFELHPDKNKGIDTSHFNNITEAYDILCGSKRSEYDLKSKFGKDYNEYQELFLIDFDYDFNKTQNKYEEFKNKEILNIYKNIDIDNFNGKIEYERLIICKSCNGSGKDLKSKLVIKDEFGNIKGIFDSEDGCDFCDGRGKDYKGEKCSFCFGEGKIGVNECKNCNGSKRIKGIQKLAKIKLEIEKDETIVKSMGNFSQYEPGKVGDLILKHK